ncbi:MAG: hypothetical protein H7274_19450 [Rhodoferax sp.]|nr:hypothetical protein [Rhodoferax sp.]
MDENILWSMRRINVAYQDDALTAFSKAAVIEVKRAAMLSGASSFSSKSAVQR